MIAYASCFPQLGQTVLVSFVFLVPGCSCEQILISIVCLETVTNNINARVHHTTSNLVKLFSLVATRYYRLSEREPRL